MERTPPTTYYTYDVRRRTRAQDGREPDWRRASRSASISGGVEVYREFAGDGTTIDSVARDAAADGGRTRPPLGWRHARSAPIRGPAQQVRYQFANHLAFGDARARRLPRSDLLRGVFPVRGDVLSGGCKPDAMSPSVIATPAKSATTRTGSTIIGARYYAAWLGRWTSADPLGIADGPNVYRYVRNNPLLFVDKTGTDSSSADAEKAKTKAKVQETIKSVQSEIDEINKKSGPLQVAQWELVQARDALRPDQKTERENFQKQIDTNGKTLNALFERTQRLQTILDESLKTLKEFDPPPDDDDKVHLGVDLQALAVYNSSPGGLSPFGSVDAQVSFVLKNVNIHKWEFKRGQLTVGHEPALGLTFSSHVLDPSDAAAGSKQPPTLTGHPQISVQADILNYTFQKLKPDGKKADVLELKLTLAPQVDLYGSLTGTHAQFQVPIQPGIELHLTEKVSTVLQVSIPVYTKGADNPPPSAGIGVLGHF